MITLSQLKARQPYVRIRGGFYATDWLLIAVTIGVPIIFTILMRYADEQAEQLDQIETSSLCAVNGVKPAYCAVYQMGAKQ